MLDDGVDLEVRERRLTMKEVAKAADDGRVSRAAAVESRVKSKLPEGGGRGG